MNTTRKTQDDRHRQELLEHLFAATSESELDQRLNDLLTPSEFSEVSKRLQIFKLLDAGIPQRQIAEQLGVGIATVTRGSRARKQHSRG
ncbi:Trp family transcriptional regulator [Spongiibacter marinus]|jgi:TrpR family trp operon transcriptional repressor|uniref:Trp family transcriptional regulator n=1 Tax=Spongiibacter marinus TaxID=354246 RepID=UPI000403DD87|nr:Trp family transcriptional regulator [Spongiibacter marinus]